jgi:hypothetical protein
MSTINMSYIQNKTVSLTILVGMFLTLFAATFAIYPIQGETGKGTDVFKVTMTIFGVDKSKGDMVGIVTVNNGQDSKVKLLDSEAPYVIPVNTTGAGGLIEYVATFPNVTVNAGDEYKVCVMTTREIKPICSTGTNSPSPRPEFADITLNATG